MIAVETRPDGVRIIRLDRAEKRNALNRALAETLIAALEQAGVDATTKAVVLAGNGPGFCAGADLAEMKALDGEARASRSALTVALLDTPARVPKPVVAAVQGGAMGAGASLALSCDMVVMAEDARLAWPEAKHAMLPRLVAPVLLRHVGPKLGFDLLATGRALGAAEALSLGLTSRMVPAEALVEQACAVALSAALLLPESMTDLKRMVHR
jgi:enoyl-CoA hydratase/carnithine racemase